MNNIIDFTSKMLGIQGFMLNRINTYNNLCACSSSFSTALRYAL